MSTRKIRLSQKLTLSFRDNSKRDIADGNSAGLPNQETDQGSSDETFDSLPDLLPYIFQSQPESSTDDLPYVVTDCSTYKLWESCTSDVNPLALQIEEAKHWLLTGTQSRGADSLQSNDCESVTIATRIGVRENLRRVHAFSPQTSIMYAEEDVSRSEALRSVQADVICDAEILEFEKDSDPLDIDGDTDGICGDCYLNLDEYVIKESQIDESTVADDAVKNSRLSSISDVVPHDQQEEHVDKDSDVKKQTQRRMSPHQASTGNSYSSNFLKEIRKQKRSTPRRRERPSSSIHLVHKMKWLSATNDDHLELDQGAKVTVNLPDKKERKTSQTMKSRRKPVSTREQLGEPLVIQSVNLQPSGHRGKKKKQPLRYVS